MKKVNEKMFKYTNAVYNSTVIAKVRKVDRVSSIVESDLPNIISSVGEPKVKPNAYLALFLGSDNYPSGILVVETVEELQKRINEVS